MTPEKQACEHCDSPLPPRWDTRGRKARFCSDACRSAAYRARKKREHATELAQARSQLSIDLRAASRSPAGDVAAELDGLAGRIRRGDPALSGCTVDERRVLYAARGLVEAAGEGYWPVGAMERIEALTRRVEGLEAREKRAAMTAGMPVFVRRETPGLHKKAKKKHRR